MPRKPAPETKHESHWKWSALLCLAVLAVYANTFGLGFALDAAGVVQGDPRVHAVTPQNLALIFQQDYWWPSSVDTLYRPFTTLSFLFNYAVLGNGDHAAGYHVVNVLLHMANVLLVFQLALLLLKQRMAAFFAALLWGVHPVLTESVANIAGRADLLATLAVLAGLLVYDRVIKSGWPVAGLFAVAVVGMFSKESAAVLPALMLLWDLSVGAGWRGGGARRAAAYAAVGTALLLMVAIRVAVFASAPVPEMPFVDNPLRGAGFVVARWTAIKMVGMDLLLLVWPLHLASERGFDQIPLAGAGGAGAWLAFAAIAAILIAVTARYRRDRVLFWCAGMFGICLLPVSNLVVLIGATMAERFLYLPSIGFAVAVAALAYRAPARLPVPAILLTAIAIFAGRTWARNGDWQDSLTLAQADVRTSPRSARVQEILASSLFARDPVHNLDAAIAAGEAAWRILQPLPAGEIYQQTPARLGSYYRLKGDAAGAPANRQWYEEALAVLERAREASQAIEKAYDQAQLARGKPLATRVAFQPVYAELGLVDLRLGRYPEAVEALRYGREVDPRTPAMYDLLADAYTAQADPRRAAQTELAKVLLLGATPESLERLARAYGEGSCVVERGSGWMRLNQACPAIQGDLCAANRDLLELLRAARLAEVAAQFAARAGDPACTDVR